MLVNCQQCGKEFNKQLHQIKNRPSHFCSHTCHDISQRGDRFISFLNKIKNRCKANNIECNISEQYLEELWNRQSGSCYLTGEPLDLGYNNRSKNRTASVDRIDSTKGYIEGNVCWVLKDLNMMKQGYSLEYFIGLCRKVVKHFSCFNWSI